MNLLIQQFNPMLGLKPVLQPVQNPFVAWDPCVLLDHQDSGAMGEGARTTG